MRDNPVLEPKASNPIEGWQFARMFTVRVGSNGMATVVWKPPTVGRWKIHASFRR
jgi:hypothetical protein